jgi:hypothetical protein
VNKAIGLLAEANALLDFEGFSQNTQITLAQEARELIQKAIAELKILEVKDEKRGT